ncbi:MAG TPA: hypothetical protein VGG33_28085 [Polyangia bacterium]
MTNDTNMTTSKHTTELELAQLDTVNGGNFLVRFFGEYVLGKALDATIDAVQEAGPAPKTEHGSIYNVQPAGFVG